MNKLKIDITHNPVEASLWVKEAFDRSREKSFWSHCLPEPKPITKAYLIKHWFTKYGLRIKNSYFALRGWGTCDCWKD